MARVTIEYPGKTVFTHPARVRITDLSAAGHLGFDNLVSLLNDAAAAFFHANGIQRTSTRSIGVIFADLAVVYQSEAFYNEVIEIQIAIGDVGDKGLDVVFRVQGAGKDKVVATAKIGVLFFDYAKHQVVAIPQPIRDLVSQWQSN